jgi:hypothetical protein
VVIAAFPTGESKTLHVVGEYQVRFRSRWEWITVTLDPENAGYYSELTLNMFTAESNNNGLQIGHWHLGYDVGGGVMFK